MTEKAAAIEPQKIEKPWGFIVMYPDGTEVPVVKHRRLYVTDEEFSLTPASLVGSAFHVVYLGQVIWQGVVVGEPQAGRYLVELNQLEGDVLNVQRLFTLDSLLGLGEEGKRLVENAIGESRVSVIDPPIEWRFYDSEERARAVYEDLQEAKEAPVEARRTD